MSRQRYVVRACDNHGTVAGLRRDRTWSVIDQCVGDGFAPGVIADLDARKTARQHATEWNAIDTLCRALAAFAQRSGRHMRDEDCTVGPDGCCLVCGVTHTEPCHDCHGSGYHLAGCEEIDSGENAAPTPYEIGATS